MPSASFQWIHGAVEKVQLAGSFTQWKPVEMEKTDDKWGLKLDLPPGEYEFKFVVDGNWLHDELLPTKTNEMGTKNNCLNVTQSLSECMSISSSIEAIDAEDDDEGWEVIEQPSKTSSSCSPLIEVERKFIVPDNYHERLVSQGFQLQKVFDEVLVDKYYDTYEHDLVNADHWLRQRNGDWELKYPVHDGASPTKTTVYHETTCIEDINSRLSPLLKIKETSFTCLMDQGVLKPFAHLETKRKCYNKEDVNVVIDATNWGHIVGEIEILVNDYAKISEATEKIELIGNALDFAHMDLNVLCSKATA